MCDPASILNVKFGRPRDAVLLENAQVILDLEGDKRIGKKRQLWKCIRSRSDTMIAHFLRHEGLLKATIVGDVKERMSRG